MGQAAIIRIYKTWIERSYHPWVNTYEVTMDDGTPDGVYPEGGLSTDVIDTGVAGTFINALVAFEKRFHLPAVQFVRATVSSWKPEDPGTYNPDELYSTALTGTGLRGGGESDTEDLRIVMNVRRQPVRGRLGKVQYRGCLVEADVNTSGGVMRLVGSSTFGEDFDEGTTFLSSVLGAAPDHRMVMIGGTLHKEVLPKEGGMDGETYVKKTYVAPYRLRTVVELVADGPSISSRDHQYFNRS